MPKYVAFLAPVLLPNTLRYARALAGLEDVVVALISSQDRASLRAVDPWLSDRVDAVVAVTDPTRAQDVIEATQALQERWGRVDRLLGVLEQLQVPLGAARTACGVPGMSLEVAKNFRDKARMKDVLRAAGLPVARHRAVESLAQARAFAAEVGFPLVLKPLEGVGAKATWRVRDDNELVQVIAALAPSAEEPAQAEEFIVATERTFEAVLIDGEPVWWSGTHYQPTPLRVLETPWEQYTVSLPRAVTSPWTEFAPIGVAAVKALGLVTGLCHMEWFQRQDGSFVIGEVGARPPGVHIMPLMSAVHNTDMVANWVRLMVHGTFEARPRVRSAGAVFFRAQGQGERIASITGLDEAQAQVGHLVIDRSLPVVGARPTGHYEGDGWAIVQAETDAEVQNALGVLVRTVRVELG
jgi:biotin carboxylase